MVTKHGKDAIEQHKITRAKWVTRKHTIFVMILVIVVWLVLDHYLF